MSSPTSSSFFFSFFFIFSLSFLCPLLLLLVISPPTSASRIVLPVVSVRTNDDKHVTYSLRTFPAVDVQPIDVNLHQPLLHSNVWQQNQTPNVVHHTRLATQRKCPEFRKWKWPFRCLLWSWRFRPILQRMWSRQ